MATPKSSTGNFSSVDLADITLDDATDLAPVPRAFYVGDTAAGDTLKVTTEQGTTLTLTGLLEGTVYNISIRRFWSTGSLAASIVALY